jgi:hypothetical protein
MKISELFFSLLTTTTTTSLCNYITPNNNNLSLLSGKSLSCIVNIIVTVIASMARTKITGRKSVGGKVPKKNLGALASRKVAKKTIKKHRFKAGSM